MLAASVEWVTAVETEEVQRMERIRRINELEHWNAGDGDLDSRPSSDDFGG